VERAAADDAEAHHSGDAVEDVGVLVPRQQHRDVGVPAEVERKQDVLVPEDVDLRAAVGGMHRIDGRIAEVGLVVERAHPMADGGRGHE